MKIVKATTPKLVYGILVLSMVMIGLSMVMIGLSAIFNTLSGRT